MTFINFLEKIKYKMLHKELKDAIINRIKLKYYRLTRYKTVQSHYDKVIKLIRKKTTENITISVGFFVWYDTKFSAKLLFEKMLTDSLFNPYIIIIPDITKGNEYMIYNIKKSYNSLVNMYGKDRVLVGYNEKDKKFIDYSSNLDIVYFSEPYYGRTHKYFNLLNLITKNILTFHTGYGFLISKHCRYNQVMSPFMSLVWKIFVETEYVYKEFKKYQPIKGKNVVLSGYCKLDEYALQEKISRIRKRIIIAPHHTIIKRKPPLTERSNFLEYANFFQELPLKYPEIDFVFRPHPHLFMNLVKEDIWGKEKLDKWLDKLLSNNNVTYSDGANHYEIFINSDAMIHDCCSFMAEYLITGNPCCFILKDNLQNNILFNEFGEECLDFHYKAFNKNDILKFIDDVVNKENDINKESRDAFVNKKIKINYPNVSDNILSEIKKYISGNI